MAASASSQRPSSRSFIPKMGAGDFVSVYQEGKKITGTVISKNDGEVVVSERGKFGAPQLHVIKTADQTDLKISVSPVKNAPYRGDASRQVDPFRKRTLGSGIEYGGSANNLDYSIQGYDVKKDQFYVAGNLNGGARFGKWVSARDLYPLFDLSTRSAGVDNDRVIRAFAGQIGEEGSLMEKQKEVPKEETEKQTKEEIALAAEQALATQEAAAKAASERNLVEKLNDLVDQPAANTFIEQPKPEAQKKWDPRPDLKNTQDYVEERLRTLKQEAANDNDQRSETQSSGDRAVASARARGTAQAARESVVLGDIAFTRGAAVPALVLAYAGGGQAPVAAQAAWEQTLRQVQQLSQELTTLLSERRAQFEVLSLAGAPTALLDSSRDRVNALTTAQQNLSQTIQTATSRHSAQELARLQTSRIQTGAGGSSLASARSIQETLDGLRVQGKGGGGGVQIQITTQSGGGGLQTQVAANLGQELTRALQEEGAFEQRVLGAIQTRAQALRQEVQQLQSQLGAGESVNAGLRSELLASIASKQADLETFQAATDAQLGRIAEARDALDQAEDLLTRLPDAPIGGGPVDGPGTQAVKRYLQSQVNDTGSSSGTGNTPSGPPPLPKNTRTSTGTGGPVSSPERLGTSGGSQGRSLGSPGRPTQVLGGRNAQSTGALPAIRPLSPLPLSGPAGELATLERDRAKDRRRADRERPAVTDIPQTNWDDANDDEDEDNETDDGEDTQSDAESMREKTDEQNRYLDQIQNGDDDASEGGVESGNDSGPAEDAVLGTQQTDDTREGRSSSAPEPNDSLQDIREFQKLAAARALQARNEAVESESSFFKGRIAKAKQKRLWAVQEEMKQKAIDVTGLAGFEAILPVLKYLGSIYLSKANRKMGVFGLSILPGYRPSLPRGVPVDDLEQQWDLFLEFELAAASTGIFALFIMSIGGLIFEFFYIFGPVIGILGTFCSVFGSVCSAAAP